MSTQPTSEVQSSTCVITDYLGRICRVCGVNIDHMRSNATHCSRACQKHSVRNENAALRVKLNNIAFAHRNRDRYIGFDGKYEGPLNICVTLNVTIRKDKGYRAMPIDVHVKPIEPRFSQVTPDDVDWAERQRAFPHSQPMPYQFKTFCPHCVDMVISAKVRATRGVYLPVEHACPRVRVYDLMGKLIEVKQL